MPPSIILSGEKTTCLTIDHCYCCLVTASCALPHPLPLQKSTTITGTRTIRARDPGAIVVLNPQTVPSQRFGVMCSANKYPQVPRDPHTRSRTISRGYKEHIEDIATHKHVHIVFLFISADRLCSQCLSVQLPCQLLCKGKTVICLKIYVLINFNGHNQGLIPSWSFGTCLRILTYNIGRWNAHVLIYYLFLVVITLIKIMFCITNIVN